MTATTSDLPLPDQCVFRDLIERHARERPDKVFIRFDDGAEITYQTFKALVERTAAGLAALGVRQGQTVTVWLPNGLDSLRVWFAINWLGAVFVPINVAYRGNLLAHVLANAGSQVIVLDAGLLDRLVEVDRAKLQVAVAIGEAHLSIEGLRVVGAQALDADPAYLPLLERPIAPWDPQSVIYTSGTTGRSKGVVSSYVHLYEMSGPDAWSMLDENDCFLVSGPLCHVSGTLPVMAALSRGGTIGITGQFSTDSFWSAVDNTRATVAAFLGVMASFIAKRPPSPDDRSHTLKKVMLIPLPDDWPDFAERFDVSVWTLYNMSELNVPIVSERNPQARGTSGRLRAGVEARIVDAHDRELPAGEAGELIVRTARPWALNSGYFRDSEATATAWRNGWFHTGDTMRRDLQGNFYFVDRLKDAIRRRGENISSFEVEIEILSHPAVRECAVVAVPNETAEDDVLAVVATTPGQPLDPLQLLDFLRPKLAHFMLPRYVRVLDNLPRTVTQKVEKHVLRSQGVTTDTWDRERAGVRVSRHTTSTTSTKERS